MLLNYQKFMDQDGENPDTEKKSDGTISFVISDDEDVNDRNKNIGEEI